MDPYYAAGFVLLAAAVATIVRLEDWPPTEWSMDEVKNIVGVFIGSAITATFFAWFYAETAGILINSIEGMIAVVMSAVGGVASIRAVLDQVKTPE